MRPPWPALAVAALVLATLVALAPAAAAVPEPQAAGTHPDVVRAWHEPEPVVPGEQWTGYLQLRAGHGFARVGYQICNASFEGASCFAPAHEATDLGNGTFRFETSDYLAGGRPVEWEAGWHVGVRWFLAETEAGLGGNGTWVPRAPPEPTEVVPIEDLYLTFDIPGGPANDAPAPPVALALVAVLLAAAARRRRA